MKVMSLAREGAQLIPVEVELLLIPGLPQIHFLGLPDQVIRESIHRIKSAIRQQGFEFPKTKQILVNIRPQHIKKSSRGVELAVAAALLWETDQLPRPLLQNQYYIYGELGLSGEVFEPEDLREFDAGSEATVLTGVGEAPMSFQRHRIDCLKNLNQPSTTAADTESFQPLRPEAGLNISFPKTQARLLQILALGQHHALLAGPAGSGKSTLARSLISFVADPRKEDLCRRKISWPPLIMPHHSISSLSLIGGGVPPKPGEISKADGGLLVMDELLEFSSACQEALREPLEEGVVRVSRGLKSETFTARFQLVATTNLCPCGQWVPGGPEIHCRFARHRCSSYQQKLSGPFLDRFEILYFTKKSQASAAVREDSVAGYSGRKILEVITRARQWRNQAGARPASAQRFDSFVRKHIWPKEFSSRRRQQAAFRVALTLADLEQSEIVKPCHVDEALALTVLPFEKMNRGF
jgi:magnesium chelatase family protein